MDRLKAFVFAGLIGAMASGPALSDDLRVGLAVEPTSIDPHFWSGMPNVALSRHVFDDFILRDKTQQFKPGLATEWKVVDETTWEFKLRPNVRWHDGSPFTADDVLFSLNRILDPNTKAVGGGYKRFVQGKQATKLDDLTIRVKTEKPYPLMIEDMANLPIVSKARATGASTEDFNSGKAAIGTGPYRFVEWRQGDRIILEANPNYWGEKPAWDRVLVSPVKTDASRITGLLNGQLDLIEKVPTVDLLALSKDLKVSVYKSLSNRAMYLHVDSNRHVSPFVKTMDGKSLFPNPLRDQRVRKALSLAIDRQAITDRVMDGAAEPASQLVPSFVFGFNPALAVDAYDPAAAKQLLKQAGLGDGFRLTVHASNDRYVNDAKIAEVIAQMWSQVGVLTGVVTQPVSVYSPRATKLEYSVVLFGYGAEAAESSSPLRSILHTNNEEAGFCCSNRGRYSNVLFDAKLQEAVVMMDRGKRETLLQEAMAIAIQDVAIIPLHGEVNIWATRKGVRYEARTDETTLAQSASKAP